MIKLFIIILDKSVIIIHFYKKKTCILPIPLCSYTIYSIECRVITYD